MKDFECLSIRNKAADFQIINQTKLPHIEEWKSIHNPDEMVESIKNLETRGAPLIGVAAALSLAQFVENGASESEYKEAAEKLRASRPTAVNLMWAIDHMLDYENFDTAALVKKAEHILDEDILLCERIGNFGAELIESGDNVLTHCNAGSLATAGIGTAIGVIQKAYEKHGNIHVYVDETRPLLQGGRLTTYEMQKLGVPYTLQCDNMAASLFSQNKIDKVIVGADRIAANGDFANKIGTYNLAVLCKHHNVPLYVAAPYSTVDKNCPDGKNIPIEMRKPEEVRREWAPKEANVYNPAFDVTPAELVSAWILDNGVYTDKFMA